MLTVRRACRRILFLLWLSLVGIATTACFTAFMIFLSASIYSPLFSQEMLAYLFASMPLAAQGTMFFLAALGAYKTFRYVADIWNIMVPVRPYRARVQSQEAVASEES